MQKLNKPLIILFIILSSSLAYADTNKGTKKSYERPLSTEYKSFTINKTENIKEAIETQLFGKQTYDMVFEIAGTKNGIHYFQHYYKINDDNICLGICNFNSLQDEAVVYVNTQKDCGAKCKVFLDKPKDKQIFYVWEPLKTIITDTSKDKIVLKTEQGIYSIILRTGIEELELFAAGLSKIESIEGLEKFPDLMSLSFNGFDYKMQHLQFRDK